MTIIAPSRPQNKPVLIFDVYIDTLVLFLPTRHIMTTEKKRLREAYGATPNMIVDDHLGYTLVAVQCPQPDVLNVLHELQEHYEGNINRVDLSFEARPDPLMSPDDQMRFIKAHLLMKHRKAGPVLEIKNDRDPNNNGAYLIPHAHTNKGARDVCLYTDLPSKLNPSNMRVAKFDVRLRRRGGFGHGVKYPSDLIDARPDEMALRHIRFVDLDMSRFERKLFKNALKGRTTEEARRLISHYKRSWDEPEYQFGYATRIRDWDRWFVMESGDHLFELPKGLTWGAVRRSLTDKGQKTVCDEGKGDQSHRDQHASSMYNKHVPSPQKHRPRKQIEPSPRAIALAEKRERDHLDARRAMNRLRLAQVGTLSPLSPLYRKSNRTTHEGKTNG
jgi:hypothetical protein